MVSPRRIGRIKERSRRINPIRVGRMKTGGVISLTRIIRTKELVRTVTSCITVNAGSRIKSSVTDVASLVTLLEIALAIYRTRLD